MPVKQKPKSGRPWRLVLIVTAIGNSLFFAHQALLGWSHDQVSWRYSFNQATVEATEAGKPLLVYFTADWCGPCKQMKAWVYSDQSVADAIEAGFVPIKIDLSTEGLPDQAIAERYDVQAIPTVITLTPDGQPISRSAGYLNKEQFLGWLDSASMRYVKLKEEDQARSQTIVEVDTTRAD